MANITNHYAPGSCVFQAGSSQNGDIHITDCTFYQGKPEEKDEDYTDNITIDDAQADNKKPVPRGPKNKFLFWLNGNEHEENVGVRNREKERFQRYLAEHKMGGKSITTTQGDTMNDIIICFIIQWKEAALISKQPSGNSIFRFLTIECGLKTSVTEKAFANKIRLWLKDKQYSIETLRSVQKSFPNHPLSASTKLKLEE